MHIMQISEYLYFICQIVAFFSGSKKATNLARLKLAHVKNKVDQSSMCYLRVFNNYDVMKELLDLILPRDVLACFEVVKVCTTSARIDIYLDEKNIPPAEYSGQGVLSKGFTVPTSIQDFPLRGRAVYLHVRRRKWQLPSGDVVSNKFSLAADGTRYSREFASFLKGILG